MTKNWNITKDYIINKPYEEVFSHLNTIISTSFNNSKFSTFGNIVSVEPPELVLMNKWISLGRPMLAEIASTKLFTRIYNMDGKSKISVETKTNPAILVFFFILIAALIIKLLIYKSVEDLKIAALYFFLAILTLAFDRFVKNILIAGFERDLKAKAL